jgi:hypothetical protein
MASLLPSGMRKLSILATILPVLAAVSLSACSPTYNWRDYNSPDAPYRVMFPAKPATYTRKIDLDGMQVNMTMTAAEVEDTMFAVGSAQAPDAAHAQAALQAMKNALIRNIGAKVTSEKSAASSATNASGTSQGASIDVEATGTRNGVPVRLVGHFVARDKRFYQVVVMGKASTVSPEQTDQFLSSFKLR